MSTQPFKELERLVSHLYDDGLSQSDMARLEELLLDNPAAQAHYRGLVDTHIALCVSASPLDADQPEDPPAAGAAALRTAPSGLAAARPAEPRWGQRLATAAALLIACGLLAVLFLQQGQGFFQQERGGGAGLADRAQPFDDVTTIPQITHVSWEGPAFKPYDDQSLPLSTVSPGAITLRHERGSTADGYMICLRPGMSVDLMASFDATGENSLSIVEFTSGEAPTVKKVTFHNSGEGPKPLHANPAAKNRRYGVLGHWSEVNAGTRPRFFLLTGVHKLAQPTPQEEWRLSKMEVLLESENAVHIGWDDSGPAPADQQGYRPDHDYDDLSASLFYRPVRWGRSGRDDGLCVMIGEEDSRLDAPSAPGAGFNFELPPGAMVMLKGASDARFPSGVVVVDDQTNKVVWSRVKAGGSVSHLGAACIGNPTDTPRTLRLVGVHKLPEESEWKVSNVKALYEQPRLTILGFDDSVGDEDYNDVRMNLLIEDDPTDGAPLTAF